MENNRPCCLLFRTIFVNMPVLALPALSLSSPSDYLHANMDDCSHTAQLSARSACLTETNQQRLVTWASASKRPKFTFKWQSPLVAGVMSTGGKEDFCAVSCFCEKLVVDGCVNKTQDYSTGSLWFWIFPNLGVLTLCVWSSKHDNKDLLALLYSWLNVYVTLNQPAKSQSLLLTFLNLACT